VAYIVSNCMQPLSWCRLIRPQLAVGSPDKAVGWAFIGCPDMIAALTHDVVTHWLRKTQYLRNVLILHYTARKCNHDCVCWVALRVLRKIWVCAALG
jgi:hypothetical protein